MKLLIADGGPMYQAEAPCLNVCRQIPVHSPNALVLLISHGGDVLVPLKCGERAGAGVRELDSFAAQERTHDNLRTRRGIDPKI